MLNPATTTENQTLGCCAITNSVRRFEKDYFEQTGKFCFLRYADIYEAVLEIINGNTDDTGLQLTDAIKGLQQLGIVKSDCDVAEIELSEFALNAALQVAPLILGQFAQGIMPDNLSAGGWADESDIGGLDMEQAGGHCITLDVAFQSKGMNCCGIGNKGWGPYGVMGEGLLLTTTNWVITCAMSQPLLVTHASENTLGPDWNKWMVK